MGQVYQKTAQTAKGSSSFCKQAWFTGRLCLKRRQSVGPTPVSNIRRYPLGKVMKLLRRHSLRSAQ